MLRKTAGLALPAGLLVLGLAASSQPAAAQGVAPVPSVKVLTGQLVSPSAAEAYYGSATTSTNGLCAAFPTNAGICTTLRPPEVKELARALRGDPDLIYEYVRNGVDTEFQYGLQKGALGAIIDKSGTAFDQANLMVELLRESGVSARYKVGTITLTGAQFQAWTGLDQAKAACQFLALGGIPAVINGSTSATCAYSGALTSVTLSHAWVEATIGGGVYQFDPAYKPYTHKAGIDVKAGMGFVAGEAASAAAGTTGTQSGVPYVTALNQTALNAKLQTWSTSLLARLRQADMQGADLADVIGGRVIQAAQRPAGGWRQTSLPYVVSINGTWTGGVADQYRTKLSVTSALPNGSGGVQTVIDTTFYVDEIYGRNLGARPKRAFNLPRPPGVYYDPYKWSAEIFLDDVVLATGPAFTDPVDLNLPITLVANRPFAAGGGTFADSTVQKQLNYNLPSLIVHGWGRTAPALAAKWDREEGVEGYSLLPVGSSGRPVDAPAQTVISGKLMRMRIAANWLAQFSSMGEVQAALAGGRITHHQSLGVVTPSMRVVMIGMPSPGPDTPRQAYQYQFLDETTVVDLESSFGLVSRTNDAASRRSALHAIAATAAMLEGSVVEQLTDSPDTASTARRFAWGNAPEASETPASTSRRSYAYTSGNVSSAAGLMVAENLPTGVWGKFAGQEALVNVDAGKTQVASVIAAYTGNGFEVTASNEARLGPGFRHGAVYLFDYVTVSGQTPQPIYARSASRQVGGALIANRYDGAGDPIEIAHVLPTGASVYKGGGGSIIKDGINYDPNKSAQVLKDRFVDRSGAVGVDLMSGAANFSSSVLDSVGSGAFPHKLERTVKVSGGLHFPSPLGTDPDGYPISPTGDTDGLVSNWDSTATLGSSGLEALGQSRADAAIDAIASSVAMQDVWKQAAAPQREVVGALVADWLGRKIVGNTVTLKQGGSTAQYVRLADGSFVSAAQASDRLEVSGSRVAMRFSPSGHCYRPGCNYALENARFWKADAVNITATGPHGDRRVYEFWKVGDFSDHRQGHRLKTWVFPQGVQLTLDYPATVGVTAPIFEIPIRVSSSLGHQLQLPDIPPAGGYGCAYEMTLTDKAAGVTRVTFTPTAARTVSQRPYPFCSLANIYTPTDATTPSLSYAYDNVGRVKEARDGVSIRQPTARGPHQFFIADGYRGERQDPDGGRYAVETLEGGRLTRTIDELGRVTTSRLDGRKRVVSRTYPEGDQDLFGYDLRDNMVSLTRKAKPGAGLADLVSTMTFGEGPLVWACASPKICNRPTVADGPRTDVVDVTNYSWDAATGNLTQILKPADNAGVRPQTDYGYTSYTVGGVPVSLMTSMTEKIDATTSTVTSYQYDPAALYWLKSVTVDSGGLNLRTCYQYNAIGDIVGVSDPRTTTCPATVQ